MKLKRYIKEAETFDFNKKKNEIIIPELKNYYNDLYDIYEGIRKVVSKDEETMKILFLLKNAKSELKKYIDERDKK